MHSHEEILDILLNSIKSKGITEKDCLLATSINTSFLTDWKKGRLKSPSYDKVIKLARYLEISLDYLFLGATLMTQHTLSLNETEWLTIYRETPEENQPHLLAMAKAFSGTIKKPKKPLKSQQISTNTDETAAGIDSDSNIA